MEVRESGVAEAQPACARDLFGERLPLAERFAHSLCAHGETLGLIGPQEYSRIWTRHIINSALLAEHITAYQAIADIGTGGGFPGLILAIACPNTQVRLIEPMERRCDWLTQQIADLNLENARVLRGRAEEFHGAFEVEAVTARAVSALKKLIPLAVPLLVPGGSLLFLKGEKIDCEIEAARKQIQRYNLLNVRVETLGGDFTEQTRLFAAQIHT